MSELLRKAWIADAVLKALDDVASRRARRAVQEFCNGNGEIACPVEVQKYVQVTKVISFDGTFVAIVSDKTSTITAEFSTNALKELESQIENRMYKGIIVRVMKSRLRIEGSNGTLYEDGQSLQDQLWEIFSGVDASLKPGKDLIHQCFETAPCVKLRLMIESVKFAALAGQIIGEPRSVTMLKKIASILRTLPVGSGVIQSAKLRPKFANLITISKSPAADMASSPIKDSREQTRVGDDETEESSDEDSSNAENEGSDADTTQFATQAITPLRPKKKKPSKSRVSFDSFDDLEFFGPPQTFGASSKEPRLNMSEAQGFLQKTSDMRKESSASSSKASSGVQITIGFDVARKTSGQQHSSSSSSSEAENESESDGSWPWKTAISAKEAHIPRDQQKILDLPQSWYPRDYRPPIHSGYDMIPKVQLQPKRHTPRSPSPVPPPQPAASSPPRPATPIPRSSPVSAGSSPMADIELEGWEPTPPPQPKSPTPAQTPAEVPVPLPDPAPASTPVPDALPASQSRSPALSGSPAMLQAQTEPNQPVPRPISPVPAQTSIVPPVRLLSSLRILRPPKKLTRPVFTRPSKPVPSPGSTPPDTIRLCDSEFRFTQSQAQFSYHHSSSSSDSESESSRVLNESFEVVVPLKSMNHPSQYEPAIALSSSYTDDDSDLSLSMGQAPPGNTSPGGAARKSTGRQDSDSSNSAGQKRPGTAATSKRGSKNSASGLPRSSSENSARKPLKRKDKRRRSKTYPMSESEDEIEDGPVVDLILPDCPQPVMNPFGQTRLQVYGMLGAQSANRWREEREKRKRKSIIQDSQDERTDAEEDDAQDDDMADDGPGSTTKTDTTSSTPNDPQSQLQQGPLAAQEESRETLKDASVVEKQSMVRVTTRIEVQETAAARTEDAPGQEDASKQSKVNKATVSENPVVTLAHAPAPPVAAPRRPGSAFRAPMSEEDDVEDDDFDSIPLVPLGKAIPISKPQVTKPLPPRIIQQEAPSKVPAALLSKPTFAAHAIADAVQLPSTAPNAQRPLVHVKRTPYARSRSFNNPPAKENARNLPDEEAFVPATSLNPQHSSVQSSAEMPDRQMTSFEFPPSSTSLGSSQEAPASSAPSAIAVPSAPSTKLQSVVQVKRTPFGKPKAMSPPRREHPTSARDPDESFVPATKFDQSTELPNRQATSFLTSSALMDSSPDSPEAAAATALAPVQRPRSRPTWLEDGHHVLTESTTLGNGKRPLDSPSERDVKRTKLDVGFTVNTSRNAVAEPTVQGSQEAASQEPSSPEKTPAFITQAVPTTLPPLSQSTPLPSSPPLAHSTPRHPAAVPTATTQKRSPSPLNVVPLQPKRSRHDLSSPRSADAGVLASVLKATKTTPATHTSPKTAVKSKSPPASPAVVKQEIPNSLSSDLGEFVGPDGSMSSQASQKASVGGDSTQSQEDDEMEMEAMDGHPDEKAAPMTVKRRLGTVLPAPHPSPPQALPRPETAPPPPAPEAKASPPATAKSPPPSDPQSNTAPPASALSPVREAATAPIDIPAKTNPSSPPSIPIIADPSYVDIRPRRLAIPGYDTLTEAQRRKRDEMRQKFFGVANRPGCVSEPSGDEKDDSRVRERLKAAEEDPWWRDEGTPLKMWVRNWKR